MSLILDALKRAERERSGERSVALEDLPARTTRESGRWGRRLALVAVLGIAGAVVWSTLYTNKPKAPPAPPVPEVETGPAREVEPPEGEAPPQAGAMPTDAAEQPAAPPPAPAQPQVQMRPQAQAPIRARSAAPAVIPGTEDVASLDDVQSPEEAAAEAPAPAPAEVMPQPAPQAAAPEEPAAAPPAATQEPVPAEPPPREARQPIPDNVPPALTQQAPLRRLREMPPDYRADFPALNVEVHVYERAPAQRFVLVNGRRYRQGERLAEGPQVVEIVQEGIVLDYRGEKILFTLGR